MNNVICEEFKLVLPTYAASPTEELPMFAENRVHQGSSGNPYPAAVNIRARSNEKTDTVYDAIKLENDYIEITLIPALGGKIFSAWDKITGYDFFYRQHVIKPASIGALGSWISGGVEFNFPMHHRPSSFMPCDHCIERGTDGGITVWMSENEPMERIKGMVGIRLTPDSSLLETRVKIFNRTGLRKSFLWWENAAVSVNPEYRIFFPPDVGYVVHHYRSSATTYPIAHGVYGGYDYGSGTDISRHGNTKNCTSYFSAASKFDFFGGYDEKAMRGVVHIADHHISTGKKMFTWAYNQLAESWERALTDTDGPYCELMAGTYTDNQPDFSWLEPYECKTFSQYWYPLGNLGVPCYANLNAALSYTADELNIQPTRDNDCVTVTIWDGDDCICDAQIKFEIGITVHIPLSRSLTDGDNIIIASASEILADYTVTSAPAEDEKTIKRAIFSGIPTPCEITSAHRAYLTGLHIIQYRDPRLDAALYFKRALEIDPSHSPSLIMLGEIGYKNGNYDNARKVLECALTNECTYNSHPESGKALYLLGLTYLALGDDDSAYDALRRAAWDEAYTSAALTAAAAIDGMRGDYAAMRSDCANALSYNAENNTAALYFAVAYLKTGDIDEAKLKLNEILLRDHLYHSARWLMVCIGIQENNNSDSFSADAFYELLHSSPSQTCLDIACELYDAGLDDEADALLRGLIEYSHGAVSAMIYYVLGDIPPSEMLYGTFPFRRYEENALSAAAEHDGGDDFAKYLLGCVKYSHRDYKSAEKAWQNSNHYAAMRGLACIAWRENRRAEAIEFLAKARKIRPDSEQLVFESAYLMNRNGNAPDEIINMITNGGKKSVKELRDDIALELCSAYCHMGEHDDTVGYDMALEVLENHTFIPCEGGEGAVTVQYMNAWCGKADNFFAEHQFVSALHAYRKAQSIPTNLNAGFCSAYTLIAYKIREAECLEAIGNATESTEIYKSIAAYALDDASIGALPLLPCYKALAMKKLGDKENAFKILTKYHTSWKIELEKRDAGFFTTTPFFISYMEDSARQRSSYFTRLMRVADALLAELK